MKRNDIFHMLRIVALFGHIHHGKNRVALDDQLVGNRLAFLHANRGTGAQNGGNRRLALAQLHRLADFKAALGAAHQIADLTPALAQTKSLAFRVGDQLHHFSGNSGHMQGESAVDIQLALADGTAVDIIDVNIHQQSDIVGGIVKGQRRLEGIETVAASDFFIPVVQINDGNARAALHGERVAADFAGSNHRLETAFEQPADIGAIVRQRKIDVHRLLAVAFQ